MSRPPTWRRDATSAYLRTLQARGLSLEVHDGHLLLPSGETGSEIELVCLLKPELLALLEEDAEELRRERAAILEFDAGFTWQEADIRAGIQGAGDGKGKYLVDAARMRG